MGNQYGIEIAKIKDSTLMALAKSHDTDGDGWIEREKGKKAKKTEYSLFTDAIKAGNYKEESVNQALGLEIHKEEETKKNKPGKLTKEQKRYRNQIKDSVKELAKTVSQEELISELRKIYTSSDYTQFIDEVETLVDNFPDYSSKKDIEKIKKAVDKEKQVYSDTHNIFTGYDTFKFDIMYSLVDQAKEAQIEKEALELYEIYDAIKSEPLRVDSKGRNIYEDNEKKLLDQVKEKIKKDDKYKDSYYKKEAFKKLEQIVKKGIEKDLTPTIKHTQGTSAKDVQEEMKKNIAEGDKVSEDVIKNNLKREREVAARHNKHEDTKVDITAISKEELRKELGDDLFGKLNAKYLSSEGIKNPNNTYNLVDLAKRIQYRAGYDFQVNRTKDLQQSELQAIRRELSEIAPGQTFKDNEIKKLLDFVAIPYEKRERNLKKALLDNLVPGLAGAFAGLGTTKQIDVHQEVTISLMNKEIFNEILNDLKEAGINPAVKELTNGEFQLKVEQSVFMNTAVLDALAGYGIGYLQGVAFSLIFGEAKALEESCVSISDFDSSKDRYYDINKFETYIRNNYSEKKADTIMTVAKTFMVNDNGEYDPNGKFDLLGFQSKLNQIAGVGSNINCDEMAGARIYFEADKPEKKIDKKDDKKDPVTDPKKDPKEEPTETCRVLVKDESTQATSTPEETTCVLNSPARYYWDEIADAYYPELRKEHPKDWSKILKKALAYDKDGNFDRNLYSDLLAGKPVETLDLPDKIEGYQRKSCQDGKTKLEELRSQRNKKAREGDTGSNKTSIKRAGRRSYRMTSVPGTNLFRATDGCTEISATGKTQDEAIRNLEKELKKQGFERHYEEDQIDIDN